MIRFLKRKEIDDDLYNACVLSSVQNRAYAMSWFLDTVADDWGILVLNNYEAVMPIPYMRALKHLKRKKIVQPFLCQQLGVFSSQISEKTELDFYTEFLKLKPKNYSFNSLNFFDSDVNKVNYELKLELDYEGLKNNYRKDRKKSLRKAIEAELYFMEEIITETPVKIYRETFSHLKLSNKFYQKTQALINYCSTHNLAILRSVYFQDRLVCSGFFLQFNNRIYYLLGASNQEGKKHGATTFLIDSVIKEFSNSPIVFDFEGSSIPSIASFYKSFGSLETKYPVY